MNNWNEIEKDGRIWFYGANRRLIEDEKALIEKELDAFCANWAAHGEKLKCGYSIENNQFLLLAVDEGVAHASGCSIDSSVAIIRNLDESLKLDLFNRLNVFLLNGDNVKTVSHQEVKEMINSSQLDADSQLVNTLPKNMGDWLDRSNVLLSESWLNKYLSKPANS